jgi:integrase
MSRSFSVRLRCIHASKRLKGITRSWRTTGKKATIPHPHSFHKIRARYVTEVAKVQPAAAQDAARHQDPATTAMYIKLAAGEIRDAVRQAVARRPVRTKLKAVK